MSKICLINQPAGLGDILFVQRIAQHYTELGYEVIFPVIDEFFDQILKNISCVSRFVRLTHDFPKKEYFSDNIESIFRDDFIYLNLRFNKLESKKKIMAAKYHEARVPELLDRWKDGFEIIRHHKFESFVYTTICNLKEDEVYAFVGDLYGSPPDVRRFEGIEPAIKSVKLEIKNGISIFHWLKVIENAKEVWTMDTCTPLIMEKLGIKADRLEMFSRRGAGNFDEVNYLMSLDWSYN